MKRIRILIICLVTILFMGLSKTKSYAAPNDSLVKYAKSAILIEAESGEVLYEYNAHTKLEPASMTKIMTMKLVLDAIAKKRLNFEDELITSEHASQMGGSQIFLAPSEKMKVRDLFKSMVIASANDAAVVLSEGISGNEEFFVNQMNDEVKKLGLKDTNFKNVTGLPIENHYSTAYDMAFIARNLLINYEDEIIPYTSKYEDYVRNDTTKPFWLVNTNKLIKYEYGVDGLKTGWTESAGYCLTCTKKKDGMRLISVVMNADTVPHRSVDTMSLLNYGFSNFEKTIILKKGTIIKAQNDILLEPSKYNILTSENIVKVTKKGEKLGNPKIVPKIDEARLKNLSSIYVGSVEVYIDDELIGTSNIEVEVKPVKKSFLELLVELIRQIF